MSDTFATKTETESQAGRQIGLEKKEKDPGFWRQTHAESHLKTITPKRFIQVVRHL